LPLPLSVAVIKANFTGLPISTWTCWE